MTTLARPILAPRPPLALVPAIIVMLAPLALPAATPTHAQGDDGVRMRRFALMAGFNDGGPTRPKLQFAASDAQSMTRVLETPGGVSPEDLLLVQEPSRVSFMAAFDRLTQLVSAGRVAGVRREVVVYYSGHSDEEGLLIGSDRVSYTELRRRIEDVPMLSNLELKLGSRHLYTSVQFAYRPGDDLAAGTEHFQSSSRRYGFGLGLGYRQPLAAGRLRFLEVEASALNIKSSLGSGDGGSVFSFNNSNPIVASLRVLLGIEVWSGLHAVVGVSQNTAIAWGGRDLNIGSGVLQSVQHSGQATVREYPGLLLGLQI